MRRQNGRSITERVRSPNGAQRNSLGQRPRIKAPHISHIPRPEGVQSAVGGRCPLGHITPLQGWIKELAGSSRSLGRCPRLLHFAPLGLEWLRRASLARPLGKGEIRLQGWVKQSTDSSRSLGRCPRRLHFAPLGLEWLRRGALAHPVGKGERSRHEGGTAGGSTRPSGPPACRRLWVARPDFGRATISSFSRRSSPV